MSEEISGSVVEGFEKVQQVFADNFSKGGDVGASVAVVQDGEYLVDLWGGWAGTRPWQADTIVNVWSTTKGFVSLCAHILIDRGQLELDKPVADYWPEFAQAGKAKITVRQLLSHRAGLMAWDEPIPPEDMFNWEKLCSMLAATEPFWEPNTASGYHARTFGHLVGKLVQCVDGRPISRFLHEEVAEPLNADIFVGVPSELEHRIADLCEIPGSQWDAPDTDNKFSNNSGFELTERMIKAFSVPEISLSIVNSSEWRSGVFPSSNGHASARGIATIYGTIASGGTYGDVRLFSPAATERMREAQPTARDIVIGAVAGETTWGMGFMLNNPAGYGPNPRAFHHGGIGGSLGFCDPEANFGFGYAMCAMGSPLEDRRAARLLFSVYECMRNK